MEGVMTDDEYVSLLKALAGKHLKLPTELYHPAYLGKVLQRISSAVRLTKVAEEPGADHLLIDSLFGSPSPSPVQEAGRLMEEIGLLDALDDAPSLVFGQFRRSAIPTEDIELLRRVGFSDDEVEVLLAVAVERAHMLARGSMLPSDVVAEAANALGGAQRISAMPIPEKKKKRKILNGIGKLLGGAAAGVGNVLLATGTLVAPNPATGYAVVASGGLAVSTFFAELGDLRGE
jgi:hypothetical protein